MGQFGAEGQIVWNSRLFVECGSVWIWGSDYLELWIDKILVLMFVFELKGCVTILICFSHRQLGWSFSYLFQSQAIGMVLLLSLSVTFKYSQYISNTVLTYSYWLALTTMKRINPQPAAKQRRCDTKARAEWSSLALHQSALSLSNRRVYIRHLINCPISYEPISWFARTIELFIARK